MRTNRLWMNLAAGAWLCGFPALSQPALPPLRVACMQTVVSNLNRNDALATIKILGKTLAARRNLQYVIEPIIYDTVAEARRGLSQGLLDLLLINSEGFLDISSNCRDLDPVMVPSYVTSKAKEYLLLTAKGDSTGLADLRGKKLTLLKTRGAMMGDRWLELQLHDLNLEASEQFFGSVKTVTKASAAILPVFFGQSDACLVNREGFEIAVELNPQLGSRLRICTNSPPVLETVLCMRHSLMTDREALLGALGEMDQDPAGQQILTLFTIKKVIPFRPEFMETARKLRERWNELHRPDKL